MYYTYFGLEESAFSIAVNPKFLYMSAQHREALAHLLYGVKGGAFVLLSGEVGSGKTTVIRSLLQQLPDHTDLAYILNPMADARDLLQTVCEELHIDTDNTDSIKALLDALQKRLLDNYAAGKKTVLLIDEAQLLSVEVLEQIRLLTNLETETAKLLQIILVAQPEILAILAQPRLRQLSQRITARFHLRPLNREDSKRYIEHRLRIAGKKDGRELFSKKAYQQIHRASGGIPRLINIICERSLMGAYAHNQTNVDNNTLQLALREIRGAEEIDSGRRIRIRRAMFFIAILLVAAFIALSAWYLSGHDTADTVRKNDHGNATSAAIPSPPAQTKSVPTYRYSSISSAFFHLFTFNGVEPNQLDYPCWQSESTGFDCGEIKAGTWDDIREVNRPAILHLVTTTRENTYVLLVGLGTEQVLLLNDNGETVPKDKQEISLQWSGQAYYLWRKPKGYEKPLAIGSTSPVVEWTARQFAQLDEQSKALTDTHFNDALKTRIEIFQQQHGIDADGIIGQQTLMKINEVLGLSKTLMKIPENEK